MMVLWGFQELQLTLTKMRMTKMVQCQVADNYCDAEDPIEEDNLVSPKERTKMVAREIWQLTNFTSLKNNKTLKSGHRTRFWCSQDAAHKKKAKPSQNPNAKHRDNVGMKRYPCESRLLITCRQNKTGLHVVINLKHHVKHVLYVDVGMPPEALQMIEEQAEWSTPAVMAAKIQSIYPQITTKQIYAAWRELSQAHWRRDDL